MNSNSTEKLVKIKFNLDSNSWHGSATETLWAEPLVQDEYKLKNSPFYAFGVSFQDVVKARKAGRFLEFEQVIRYGGHSTYRIKLMPKKANEFKKWWDPIQAIGPTYEEGHGGLYAVDIPPDANIFEAYKLLEAGEEAGIWTFEEGHCGHSDT